eukprot:scaffold41065_cov80-Phaeocystis_antarctica.AAC.1
MCARALVGGRHKELVRVDVQQPAHARRRAQARAVLAVEALARLHHRYDAPRNVAPRGERGVRLSRAKLLVRLQHGDAASPLRVAGEHSPECGGVFFRCVEVEIDEVKSCPVEVPA